MKADIPAGDVTAPGPHQGLLAKLFAVMLPCALLFGAAAWWLSSQRLDDNVADSTLALEQAVHANLATQLGAVADDAQILAASLAALQGTGGLTRAELRAAVPTLADRHPLSGDLAAIGLWPEPAGTERGSSFWIRDGRGWAQREDYNDPRTVGYAREPWYTPARYADGGRCYWTPVYVEPLGKRAVVSCAMPVNGARGFEGVVTVSLDVAALDARLAAATADEHGYALLLDREGHALALSTGARKGFGSSLALGRNIAELAQKQPGFGPLALALHRRNEALLSATLHGPRYDVRSVSTLKDNTRDMARADAESALASLWQGAPLAGESLRVADDPVLGERSYAVLTELPRTQWQLSSVTPAREGATLARSLVMQSLAVAAGAAALCLLFVLAALQWLVVRPLRRMARNLAASTEDAAPELLSMDTARRDEIGALAHWQNERSRALRDAQDRLRLDRSQLAVETSERQRAQDTLARLDDRHRQLLSSVDDAVIYVDEHGRIDGVNLAARTLLGRPAGDLEGQPLDEVLQLRLGGEHGTELANIAATVIERGARLDYADGVFLGSGEDGRELRLTAAPLTSRNGRRVGCVVTAAHLAPAAAATEPRRASGPALPSSGFDPVTGLGDRGACERRLLDRRGDALSVAVLDVLRLSDVNTLGGHAAGDEVLAQVGARLADIAGGTDTTFRLPGDQFAVLLPTGELDDALDYGRRLQRAVADAPYEIDNRRFDVQVTVGLQRGLDGLTPPELLRRAGVACVAARKRPGRLEHWEAELDAALPATADDSRWVARIRNGLDSDLFHLTTQRIVPAHPHDTEGEVYEMLLALEDEEGFWAPPSAFLPVAERHGLSAELDRWVIDKAIALLQNETVTPRLAFIGINLSGTSLADPALLDFLAERLSVAAPKIVSKLCFELREADIDDHPQRAQRLCEAMRALGGRVAIDRYRGRRAADLNLLRRLPATLVKLDAAAYPQLADDDIGQMQAESQLRLFRRLGKRVIVTNVDNEQDLAAWRRLGADYVQGYAVAKPSPIVFA